MRKFTTIAAATIAMLVMFTPMLAWAADQPVVSSATEAKLRAEEQRGADLLQKVQSGELSCAAMTDDDFDAIGEYFVGLMSGSSHAAMNAMMQARFGADGETRMHVAMGRRLSECDSTEGFFAGNGAGYLSMRGSGMMGGAFRGGLWNVGSLVTTFLVWMLLISGIAAIVTWIRKQQK